METIVPRSTWQELREFPLDRNSLKRLLDNEIAAIRISDFATVEECHQFAAAVRAGNIKRLTKSGTGYIGMAQVEYRRSRPKSDYFDAVADADADMQEVFDNSFDPLARMIKMLQAHWDAPVHVAREDLGKYFAGIVRLATGGLELHADWAPLNGPDYGIARIDGQIGWNLFAESLPFGGDTLVCNAPWDPPVQPGAIPESYPLDHAIVEGAPSLRYEATLGDVVLFNTRNPHQVFGNDASAGCMRVTIGSFVGRMPDRSLVLWS